MVRISMKLSFGVASLISSLSIDVAHAASNANAKASVNNKLYHDRKGSQIEEIFRKLPMIEKEVESLFDDASFFSSFGASPQVEQKANQDVEDLFRRLSQEQFQKNAADRKLSFLGNKLQEEGILGGDGVRNRDTLEGSVEGSAEAIPTISEELFAPEEDLPSSSSGSLNIEKVGKSMKSFKGGIGGYHKQKDSKDSKDMKKGKRYKGKLGR